MVLELPRIKVCGMTRAEDVQCARDAGADALGFVHYPPSARHAPVETVAKLVHAADGLATIAVLVDATPTEAAELLRATGITAVQLCGGERADDWYDFEAPILRRLGVDAAGQAEQSDWLATALGFVLDHPSAPGGTGRTVDAAIARDMAHVAPCLLAGGLDDANVLERVRAVAPYGVDASSRLESQPGIKSAERVRAFVQNARRALAQASEERT